MTEKNNVGGKKFQEIKKNNRELKEKTRLQKKIAKQRSIGATIGNLADLQESFQKFLGEQSALLYQTNLNLRALFKLLIVQKVIDEKELGDKIKSLLKEDRNAFSESQKNGEVENEK